MQCLLSQISSPSSPEFQDNYFLAEPSSLALPAVSGYVTAACTRSNANNDKHDDDDNGSKRKFFNIATLPVPESIENGRTKEDSGIVSYESEGSHDQQLQNQLNTTTHPLCFTKGFIDTKQNRHAHDRSSKDEEVQLTQDAFNSVVKSKANVVSYDVKCRKNAQFYQGIIQDVSLSSDSDCDSEVAACSHNHLTIQLDTGSTVSLNEFLDLAITDFDYDNGCASWYEQKGGANDENCQALLSRPNEYPLLEKKQINDNDFEIQNICHGFAEATENPALIMLPDVCPDEFNRNSKSAKPL